MLRSLFLRVLPLLAACLPLACNGSDGPGLTDTDGQGLVVTNPVNPDRPLYFDFDRVSEGEVREHTYLLDNTDPRPITVNKLMASCGCTVPEVFAIAPDGTRTRGKMHGGGDVVVVPVGGQLELRITTDTKHVRVKNQHKLNMVRMTCDSPNEPYLSFEQHLWVVLAFNATPRVIDLRQVPEGGGGSSSTELFPALPGSQVRVTGVQSFTDGITVEYHEEERLRGNVTVVTAELPPGLPRGAWKGEIRLNTTTDDGTGEGEVFVLGVRAHITTDVVSSPPSLIFSPMDEMQGATAQCVIRALIPGERVMVTGHRMSGDLEGVTVEYEPDAPGTDGRSVRWNVRLHLEPRSERKALRGTIEFDTDIESVSTLRLTVTGTFQGSTPEQVVTPEKSEVLPNK